MIIGFHSIQSSSGFKKTSSHIFHGEKNENIVVKNGNEETLKDMFQDSQTHNHKFFCLHTTISPQKDMSDEQLKNVVKNICNEFKRNTEDCILIEHQKERSDKTTSNKHYHLILPYTNPETGTQLNFRNKNPRGEKISREYEIENNENLTQGKHNWSVLKTFEKEGKQQCVDRMKVLISEEKNHVRRSHTRTQQQKLERKNISLPNEKEKILQLYKSSPSMSSFISSMKKEGYDIKEGDKKNTYIVEKSGHFLGSCDRLIGMKKKEFNEKYQKEINENVQSIPKKRTSPKIRFKEEGEAQKPEETNTTQHNPTAPKPSKIRFNKGDGRVRKETYDNQPRDTKEYGQNSKSVRRSRFRTESTVGNLTGDKGQSTIDNRKIEQELKKLEREIKNKKFIRIQEKNIRNYENRKIEKKQKENEKLLSEHQILLKIIDELCNRLFGIPTKKQLETVGNLVKLSSSKYNKNTLMKIINIELKEVVFPKSLKEEQLNNLSSDKKDKEIKQIKKIYLSQSKLIKDINKKYNTELPTPSFSEFLESHKNRNELCKELLVEEIKKEEFIKAENVLNKYIDNCEKSLKVPHSVTDINEIKKDMSDKLFSSFQSSKKEYDGKEKEYNDIKIKWFDKYFNKSKIEKKEFLEYSLSELKQNMNKEEDKYDHFKHFGNEISKVESDKRIRENKDITDGWKYKKSLEQLPVLQNLKSSLNEDIVEKINNGELNNLIKDELEKIKIQNLENEKIQSLEKDKIENDTEHKEDNVVKLRFR